MKYYFTPYIAGNLGQAYNHYCSLVPNDDDWITFMDGDIMQLHLNWGEIWENILDQNPDAGIISCLTNRIGCDAQKSAGLFYCSDITKHKHRAKELYRDHKYELRPIVENCMSGFFFSFKKSTWKSVGGFCNGILHVDVDFYKKVREIKTCYIAIGFYVLHYYRLCEGSEYKKHLLKERK